MAKTTYYDSVISSRESMSDAANEHTDNDDMYDIDVSFDGTGNFEPIHCSTVVSQLLSVQIVVNVLASRYSQNHVSRPNIGKERKLR